MRTEDRETVQVNGSPTTTATPSVPGAGPNPPARRGLIVRYILFALLAFGGLTFDLWSKWAVFNRLNFAGQLPVWDGTVLGMSVNFQLATTFNHGALWGIGQNQTWLFALLSFVAIGAIGYFVWTRQAIATPWLTVATGLLLAGTMGNLYDRLGLHGWKDQHGLAVYAVRDFLDFVFFNNFHWATFNFADTYLVTGAIMLVLHSFWTPIEEPAPKLASPGH